MIFPNSFRPKPRISHSHWFLLDAKRQLRWICRGGNIYGYGATIEEAYYDWLENYDCGWRNY